MKAGRSARNHSRSGPGVVQREVDARMSLEGLDHRQVRLVVDLGEDPAEVADGLMVVDRERQRDPPRHGSPITRLR